MEAAQPFEASGTAPNPTRPELSARNSNTAHTTWSQATVKPADWTEQFLYRFFLLTRFQLYIHNVSVWMAVLLVRFDRWPASGSEVEISTQNSDPSHYMDDTNFTEIGFLIFQQDSECTMGNTFWTTVWFLL
jgi:hypothetical protein